MLVLRDTQFPLKRKVSVKNTKPGRNRFKQTNTEQEHRGSAGMQSTQTKPLQVSGWGKGEGVSLAPKGTFYLTGS